MKLIDKIKEKLENRRIDSIVKNLLDSGLFLTRDPFAEYLVDFVEQNLHEKIIERLKSELIDREMREEIRNSLKEQTIQMINRILE